jgi:hypothetical protein
MPRLFILFLIALLPLRGWTMERMAFDMGSAQKVALSATAGTAEQEMGADCPMHLQAASAASAATDLHGDAPSPQHKGCQSCQLCMPLAALDAPTVLVPAANPQMLPPTGSSRFVSADRARDAKPPIS